jgi:hypothetical protein
MRHISCQSCMQELQYTIIDGTANTDCLGYYWQFFHTLHILTVITVVTLRCNYIPLHWMLKDVLLMNAMAICWWPNHLLASGHRHTHLHTGIVSIYIYLRADTLLIAQIILHQMSGWFWITTWKGCTSKQPHLILRYCNTICINELGKSELRSWISNQELKLKPNEGNVTFSKWKEDDHQKIGTIVTALDKCHNSCQTLTDRKIRVPHVSLLLLSLVIKCIAAHEEQHFRVVALLDNMMVVRKTLAASCYFLSPHCW